MTDYVYAITATLNDKVNLGAVHDEADVALPALTLTSVLGGTTSFTFQYVETLSAGEKTTLDGVVAAHTGEPIPQPPELKASFMVAPAEFDAGGGSSTAWKDVGYAHVDAGALTGDVTKTEIKVMGGTKANGATAEMRLLYGATPTTIIPITTLVDSGSSWDNFDEVNTVDPPTGPTDYILQIRRNSSTNVAVRGACLSVSLTFA